jgi:hypothetical protein
LTDPNIGELEDAIKADRPNYGVWVSRDGKGRTANKDNIKKLIDEDISGIEYQIDLPFKRAICDIDNLCKK